MRILHVASAIDPRAGGPSSVLMGLTVAQVQAGLDVSLISQYAADSDLSAAEPLRQKGVSVQLVGPCSGPFFSHPQLKAALEDAIASADVVHIHATWEDIQYQAARLAHRRGVPYVFTPHGMLTTWSLRQRRIGKMIYMLVRLRRYLDRAALLHFATEVERESVGRLKLKPRTVVEPLGIDTAEFDQLPAPGSFRRLFPAVGDRPYVTYLGRIHENKGLELLVPAFAKAGLNGAALVIAGPDSPQNYRSTVERSVQEHGIADRVIFTGMLRGPDRLAVLADAALMALPSFHENFGMSVVEALACGTPVIISDQVSLHPDVTEGQVGAVVPTDANSLAAELRRWMNDPALRQAAAARAKPFARQRYDWRSIASRWVEHYRSIAPAR